MANIPTEVVESCIFPRLPVKTLVRFKCVSKSWKTLISSSNFLHLHHRHANRLLVTPVVGQTLLQVHNLDSPLDPPFLCPYPYPDPYNEKLSWLRDKMTVLASCEFFILVGCCWTRHAVYTLFLLNPSTLSYHKIPFEDVQRLLRGSAFKYGLYFDEVNDDCKVVRIVDFNSDNEYAWEIKIYSSKTNLWRLIEHKLISSRPLHCLISNYVACLNNLLYVIVDTFIDNRIRCFDIRAERWTNDIIFPHKINDPDICLLDGSLCVLGIKPTYDEKIRTRTYDAWVLNESGVKESWVKLMSIIPKNYHEPKYRPIAYRKGSRHEILCRRFCDSQLFWYDLKSKVGTRAESGGCARDGSVLHSNVDHICKQSLIYFEGGERIKLNQLGKEEGEEDHGNAI